MSNVIAYRWEGRHKSNIWCPACNEEFQQCGDADADLTSEDITPGQACDVCGRDILTGRLPDDEGAHPVNPVAGTTRYLCPLECGWHHDVPPPTLDRIAELGATADPAARDFQEAVSSVVRSASLAEADRTETALRDHLDTHTTEQFVRTIQTLRAELATLKEATP